MRVTPIVCPKEFCHFIHDLFTGSASQVVFTLCGKYSFSNCLCEYSEDTDSVGRGEVVEEFVVVKLNDGDEFGPAYPRPIELDICDGCADNFSSISCSHNFIQ